MSAKLRRNIFALAAAAWVAGAAGSAVLAADQPAAQSLVVVVVDTSRVLQESKAGKMIQSQMQQQVGTYQKSITKQDEELSTAQQDLQRQQAILSQDAFAVKLKEFDQRVTDARKRAQEAQQNLAESQRGAVATVEDAMLHIVADLAKERGANVVLNKTTVVMFDTRFDVTDDIIKRLDEKLPAVTVSFNRTGGQALPAAAAPSKAAPPKKKP
jgi:Skp family chaperone for outer membrane proteins